MVRHGQRVFGMLVHGESKAAARSRLLDDRVFDSWGYKTVTQIKHIITPRTYVIGADDNKAIDTYLEFRTFEQSTGREGKVECQDPPGTASDDRNEFPVPLLWEKGKRRRLSAKLEEAGGFSLGM